MLFKKAANLVFKYGRMGSFAFLLLPKTSVSLFCFSYIGNVSVTVGEMQIDEFWQASGGRFSSNLPSVLGLLFQSSELRLRLR